MAVDSAGKICAIRLNAVGPAHKDEQELDFGSKMNTLSRVSIPSLFFLDRMRFGVTAWKWFKIVFNFVRFLKFLRRNRIYVSKFQTSQYDTVMCQRNTPVFVHVSGSGKIKTSKKFSMT